MTDSTQPRASFASFASSAMLRTASADSQSDGQTLFHSLSENETPSKKSRGFLDRVLGRSSSANASGGGGGGSGFGHRPSPSASVLIPNASPMANSPPQASPTARPRPSLNLQPISNHSPKLASDFTTPPAISPSAYLNPHDGLNLNTLSESERAEKVKRNRKLVQILGNEIAASDALDAPPPHLRNAFLQSTQNVSGLPGGMEAHLAKQARRHSSPISASFQRETFLSPRVLRRNVFQGPVMFSSDDDDDDEASDEPTAKNAEIPPSASIPRTVVYAPSIKSFDSELDYDQDDEQTNEETERARKRATIAKLHRFLGSRVPPELVIPSIDGNRGSVALAGEAVTAEPVSSPASSGLRKRKSLKKVATSPGDQPPMPSGLSRVLSSPSAAFANSGPSSNKHQRKPTVSGTTAVPHSASLLRPGGTAMPVAYLSDGELYTPKSSSLTAAQRVHIMRKQKKIAKMLGACPPGTMKHQSDYLIEGDFDPSDPQLGILPKEPGHSRYYTQHRYSLNSLEYLVKNNDQGQLQDLLTYMKDESDGASLRSRSHRSSTSSRKARRSRHSTSASIRSNATGKEHDPWDDDEGAGSDDTEGETTARRRTSTNTARDYNVASTSTAPVAGPSSSSRKDQNGNMPPSPTDSFLFLDSPPPSAGDFQQRRRQAAKLSSFFGVEYRELFTDVLEVIEDEVKNDSVQGHLSSEETQELLIKLRKLKRV